MTSKLPPRATGVYACVSGVAQTVALLLLPAVTGWQACTLPEAHVDSHTNTNTATDAATRSHSPDTPQGADKATTKDASKDAGAYDGAIAKSDSDSGHNSDPAAQSNQGGHNETGGRGAKASGGAGSAAGPDDRSVADRCKVDVSAALPPTVWLVIDGSGSMVETFGDRSRWTALREALMDPTGGVVKPLEHEVSWGMVIYDGAIPGNLRPPLPDGGAAMFSAEPATTCPRLVMVEPKPDNYSDIDTAYPPSPLGGSTPTDKALKAVLGDQPSRSQPVSDDAANLTIVVLATDGAPNNECTNDVTMVDAAPNVINVVGSLASMNIKTFVISLAGDDHKLMQHLTTVAAKGGTNHPPFVPKDEGALRAALKEIVGPDPACDLQLRSAVVPERVAQGTVSLAGKKLKRGDSDGWSIHGTSILRLSGSACATYKTDRPSVEIELPCDALSQP